MNDMQITLSQSQIALMLELLKPYAELSVSLSRQYKNQLTGAAEIPHAKKIEEEQETK
jgi:hypothetical protein